jgi:hypothetical protein
MSRTKTRGSEYERGPISDPGKLSASERKRKAKEIIVASGADTVEYFEKVVRSIHGITFREQTEIWLEQMKNRKRKPVAPSTLENGNAARGTGSIRISVISLSTPSAILR